jgi:hypothetical protein
VGILTLEFPYYYNVPPIEWLTALLGEGVVWRCDGPEANLERRSLVQ